MLSSSLYRKKYVRSIFTCLMLCSSVSVSIAQNKALPGTNRQKLSPDLLNISAKEQDKEQRFTIAGTGTSELISALKNIITPLQVVQVNEASHAVVIKTSLRTVLDKILPLKEVIFADRPLTAHTEIAIIGYNRSFHGINAVDYSIPGANGKNIIVGVKEQSMESADLDLYKRVLPSSAASASVTSHATVISSIIGGAGNSFYDGRGIANGCKFFPSTFDNLFADDATLLNNNKVTVQNHSYGTVIQQFYGAEAVSYDALTWNNKNIVPVFSAGNQGTAAAATGTYSGIAGFANLTGNFKMAKNIISVGAVDNKGVIAPESSAGPLYDGRIAPQLTALGPNGTSDAAAMVSGAIAVMQQVYADSNSQALPPASLVKALLYNNADDIYTKGIDFKTGYGLLNSYAAVKAVQQKKYDGAVLAQGQSWSKNLTLPASIAQLKITLSWTDSIAALNNSKALLNDLDLEVQEMSSGTIYKPWCLSTAARADSLAKEPIRKRDSLNTSEQVSIALPSAGVYQVRVTATSLANTLVPFHIAYRTDTLNTFQFTSPQHASDVNPEEDPELRIRWTTFVADTNQAGNLYISYNSGAAWQPLKANHKIYTNQYLWPIKDTASRAILKMETSFGNFLSKEFIISKVIRPQVDFLCNDSFRLSWNKHIYANGYTIFCLTDSAYLKPILTVTDSFVVMNRSLYPSLVYAVEPLPGNGIPAARSIASNITLQGVQCFYKTFYHTLQDGNQLRLILELSAPSFVDSIYFEQVTASGQILKNYEGKKVTAPGAVYDQLINDAPSGTSHWRARLRMKNGSTLYTDIIDVLTSGKKYIVFYPNPVSRNSSLNYVTQQGLPPGSQLQFFDLAGRLLRTCSPPDNVDVSKWSAGMVLYKLLSPTNQLLETGKLLIQ